MRKMLLTPLIVCIVALLSLLSMPVHATKPITVSGAWSWMAPSADFNVIRVAHGNTFVSAVEIDQFTGTFEGSGNGVFTLEMHPCFNTGQGQTLFTGTVLGKSGTLVIKWVGNTKNDLGYWWFEWTILSGTGELANLRGQGTGWGPGPEFLDEYGEVELSGKIVFMPD